MNIILPSSSRKEHGGAILLTALLIAVFASALASYLLYAQNEYTVVARSQTWNNSLVIAEAGVEEAMAMVNKYSPGNTTPITNWATTVVAADSWTVVDYTANRWVYKMQRAVDSSNTNNYYIVYVTNVITSTSAIPAISVTGYANWNSSRSTLTAASASRTVFVQTTPDAFTGGGLLARATMDFKGNNVTVDSFDSSDPAKSLWQTNRFYQGHNYGTYTSAYRQAEAIVGTDGLLINVGNADIYGYVDTGPGGTAALLSQGSVGDIAWVSVATPGIESGHARDDMNLLFSDPTLPIPAASASWNTLPNVTTTVGGVTYSYCITNALALRAANGVLYYKVSSQLQNGLCCTTTNVILYLPSGMKFNSSDTLCVSTNADLAIYSGDNIDTGNGYINNINQYAPCFKLYGLPAISGLYNGCLSIDFGPNCEWTGYIYAPSADVNFKGGGKASYDMVGSMVCGTVQVNGHYNFHFDETLKIIFPPSSFIATRWQEN